MKDRKREEKEEEDLSSEEESDGETSSDSESSSEDEAPKNITKGNEAPAFSDENAQWLKPAKREAVKGQLLFPPDDEEEDEEEEEELLEVEKESRRLDEEMERERRDAEAEMRRTIAEETEIFHLPTAEELENDQDRVVPPSEIRERVEGILGVLADFKARREPGRARSDYTDQLVADLAELFGYLPELAEYLLSMFGPAETVEFIEASDRPRPLVVRTNTLKARRKDLAAALMKRGVSLDPLANWSKVGLKIVESPVPIGATPEYLAGHYMLQSAASMCPVLALSPLPKERCLDMSAAPGGKTSYMAQLMRNTGVLVANDLKADRQKATVANLHRLGVKNVITCVHDGRKLGDKFRSSFDRILLDAPCSGLGVISRDPSVKVQRTIADVKKCGHLQKELLLAAIDALNHKSKTGAFMVYSTCSVSVAENEEVVNYALSKRDIKIVDTGLDFGKPGFTRYQTKRFHPSVALTRRFYPHVHNMDGFYVCKIKKISDRKPEDTKETTETSTQEAVANKVQNEKKEEKVVVEKATRKLGKNPMKPSKHDLEKPDDEKTKKKRARSDRVSIPPKKTVTASEKKQKKRRLNAKVTKPRRKKTAD